MESVTATAARRDIYNLIANVNENCVPIAIASSKGKGAVLIGEDEWSAIEETLYLTSIPGMAETIVEGMNTPLSECLDEIEFMSRRAEEAHTTAPATTAAPETYDEDIPF